MDLNLNEEGIVSDKEYFSDYLFKLVLIGDTCVGKSCLLVRFADDSFQENYLCTIGVDFRFRTLQINKATTKLQIWDTAGQERYRTITNAYYKGADGIIIVFDITNRESFLSIDSWLEEIHKHVGDDVLIMVFANKSDLLEDPDQQEEIQVTEQEIKDFQTAKQIPVVRTSARTGLMVDESFIEMTKQLIAKKNTQGDRQEKKMGLQTKRLDFQGKPEKKVQQAGCCV